MQEESHEDQEGKEHQEIQEEIRKKIIGIIVFGKAENGGEKREEFESSQECIVKIITASTASSDEFSAIDAFVIPPYIPVKSIHKKEGEGMEGKREKEGVVEEGKEGVREEEKEGVREEEKTKEIEEIKAILNKIRFEETKGKPVLAFGNAAALLLGEYFIPEAGELVVTTEEVKKELPIHVKIISANTQGIPFITDIQEDEIIDAVIKTRHGKIQIKNQEITPKERASIFNNLFINDQVAFCYTNEHGNLENREEINPLRSEENIAALCNKRGNVLLLVPEIGDKKICKNLMKCLTKASE